jgi:2-amino-4-hydroxy-6-hydroxymethyldihydropteridine diphosphokinase
VSQARILAHLALGANLADRIEALREATRRIAAEPEISLLARSRIYETPPWGKTDQPAFANAVLTLRTSLAPRALLETCLEIERAMGRVRLERWGPRRIDIDVLTYGDEHIAEPHLTIPHPAIADRAFVLVPLLEIAPDFTLDGRTGADLLARLDRSGIKPAGDLA